MMKVALKQGIQGFLGRFDLRLVNRQYLDYLVRTHVTAADLWRIAAMPSQHTADLLRYLPKSKAQLRQDLFVLSQLALKQNGYFVEFGATDGIDGSSTYLLERSFGWTGILAEPARFWHEALARNRRCRIDHRCVWSVYPSTPKAASWRS